MCSETFPPHPSFTQALSSGGPIVYPFKESFLGVCRQPIYLFWTPAYTPPCKLGASAGVPTNRRKAIPPRQMFICCSPSAFCGDCLHLGALACSGPGSSVETLKTQNPLTPTAEVVTSNPGRFFFFYPDPSSGKRIFREWTKISKISKYRKNRRGEGMGWPNSSRDQQQGKHCRGRRAEREQKKVMVLAVQTVCAAALVSSSCELTGTPKGVDWRPRIPG